jgi:hypothetical protein
MQGVLKKRGDLMGTIERSEKPENIVLAVKMLYGVVGIGIVRAAMTVIRHADVRSPYFLILLKLLLYSISIYLIYEINKGKNWTRWVLLVILAFGIPLSILPAFDSISHSPVNAILIFLQLALYIAAMIFLFHKSASEWFASKKDG